MLLAHVAAGINFNWDQQSKIPNMRRTPLLCSLSVLLTMRCTIFFRSKNLLLALWNNHREIEVPHPAKRYAMPTPSREHQTIAHTRRMRCTNGGAYDSISTMWCSCFRPSFYKCTSYIHERITAACILQIKSLQY